MAKPAILIVDDEPQVLNAVERDLKAHYRSEYRVVKALSGQEALESVQELQRRAGVVALFLVDQRMPGMSGTEFLQKARDYFPEARKVLLTAYADTNAAIESINQVGLDYYLMKPWDPPEENLYPVLDDLLSDWKASATLPYEGIQIAGTLWSAGSHAIKDFLVRNQIPYKWLDIEKDPQAKRMVEEVQPGQFELPVLFFPDGTHLIQPAMRALAEKIGLQTRPAKPFYDLAIVGAGPAGLAAEAETQRLLDEIHQGAGRIADIVKALKSYAYLDQAPQQEIDLHEGLENTLVILRHKLKQGVEVVSEFDRTIPDIAAYGSELNQVWTNLIDNAIDAMQGEGRLTLRTRQTDGWVEVLLFNMNDTEICACQEHIALEPVVVINRLFITNDTNDTNFKKKIMIFVLKG